MVVEEGGVAAGVGAFVDVCGEGCVQGEEGGEMVDEGYDGDCGWVSL